MKYRALTIVAAAAAAEWCIDCVNDVLSSS